MSVLGSWYVAESAQCLENSWEPRPSFGVCFQGPLSFLLQDQQSLHWDKALRKDEVTVGKGKGLWRGAASCSTLRAEELREFWMAAVYRISDGGKCIKWRWDWRKSQWELLWDLKEKLFMCTDILNTVPQHPLSVLLLNHTFHLYLGKLRASEVQEGSPSFWMGNDKAQILWWIPIVNGMGASAFSAMNIELLSSCYSFVIDLAVNPPSLQM